MAQTASDEASSDSGVAVRERQSTFHSLRYPNYRYLWTGQVGASASMWMEQVARPLLILELTDSALMLGLLAATRSIPQLLIGIWAGVLADRMDKKRLLGLTQAVTFVTHLVTALLILAGVIEAWMVFLTTFIGGSSMAFNQPTRQSLVAKVVPPESLQNAVALNSAAVSFMRIGGAGIAGLLLAALDAFSPGDSLSHFGFLYLFQALIYVLVIITTTKIVIGKLEQARRRSSMITELFEGFSYAKHDRTILFTLLLSLVIFIWGMPYQSVFVPLLATEKLGLGSSGTGLMIALTGLGAFLGSLVLAATGGLRRRGIAMLTIISVFALSLLFLAQSPSLVIAIPALLISGAANTCYISIAHSYVLGRTAPELHGRVMSLFSLDRGLVPLGAAIAGFLAEVLGPSSGLMVMAAVCLVATVLIALFVPLIRRID